MCLGTIEAACSPNMPVERGELWGATEGAELSLRFIVYGFWGRRRSLHWLLPSWGGGCCTIQMKKQLSIGDIDLVLKEVKGNFYWENYGADLLREMPVSWLPDFSTANYFARTPAGHHAYNQRAAGGKAFPRPQF